MANIVQRERGIGTYCGLEYRVRQYTVFCVIFLLLVSVPILHDILYKIDPNLSNKGRRTCSGYQYLHITLLIVP
jgi:hypothetical protein